jgi:hypothetical protein
MLSNQMKWRDVTPHPPWFYFRQQYWKMPSNIPESCFAKRVNTRKGCWYHNRQDQDPSLTLSNIMKWQDVTPSPPDSISGNDIGRCTAIHLNLV